jgi:cyanate permease
MNVTDILVLSAALMLIGGLGLNFELLNEVLTWKVMLGTGLITIITVGLTSIVLMIKKQLTDEKNRIFSRRARCNE